MTLANKILVSSGTGFLTITDRHMEQFNTLLLDYYNTGFLYANCIQGIGCWKICLSNTPECQKTAPVAKW